MLMFMQAFVRDQSAPESILIAFESIPIAMNDYLLLIAKIQFPDLRKRYRIKDITNTALYAGHRHSISQEPCKYLLEAQ